MPWVDFLTGLAVNPIYTRTRITARDDRRSEKWQRKGETTLASFFGVLGLYFQGRTCCYRVCSNYKSPCLLGCIYLGTV